MDDIITIAKIRNGDESRLRSFYMAHREEFIAWAMKTYRCAETVAAGAYRSTIITLYEHLIMGNFIELKDALKSYLYTIGEYKILEQLRLEGRLKPRAAPEDIMDSFGAGKWDKIAVEQALRQMDMPYQQVLRAYYYKHQSIEEIARRMGYARTDEVRKLKYRAILRLQGLLKGQKLQCSGSLELSTR